jgi:hypothetical protein
VAGEPSPERRNGAWDEEKCRRSEQLFNPCLEEKGDHLTGDLGRGTPNREGIKIGIRSPGLGPITVAPGTGLVMHGWQEVHVFLDQKGIEGRRSKTAWVKQRVSVRSCKAVIHMPQLRPSVPCWIISSRERGQPGDGTQGGARGSKWTQ